MAQYGYGQNPQYGNGNAQNLQFYSSSFSNQPVSGHSTPFQAGYGAPQTQAYPAQYGAGFAAPGVSGQMGMGASGLRTGWFAAFGTEGYDGEPPLLEELGVNFGHIKMKTLAVLNPFGRIDQHIMDDSDVAGPILFFLIFGTALLLSGKLHFGYIYGLALLGTILLHSILSLMSPPVNPAEVAAGHDHGHPQGSHFGSSLTFPRSASVLGYCLLPLVLVSIFGIILPLDGLFGYFLTSLAIMWCAHSSSSMFTAVGRMSSMRGLVAYPMVLFYGSFGIMAIFSSRGTGQLAKATGS
ncbi:golgi membrane protein-like protein [Dothidotthia symphoricarpi CBS 119687]|uniref:Protein YIP n=1 Tax=Dothidotthia symphoricarpi CBS 119687 TaxID=1392245 RepID=A0A6A6ARP9_9PLEO|nr:golgi membrane protein-like protein [Dothidotthia symphoricarpi CBS 119687]KAF2133191.1 golgi membrane protein-like protein [Dothidotthia symphoricarpi CBS 119687]